MAGAVVCRIRTSCSNCSAMVLCYQVVAREAAVVHSGVVRPVAPAASWRRPVHWRSGEVEGGCWS